MITSCMHASIVLEALTGDVAQAVRRAAFPASLVSDQMLTVQVARQAHLSELAQTDLQKTQLPVATSCDRFLVGRLGFSSRMVCRGSSTSQRYDKVGILRTRRRRLNCADMRMKNSVVISSSPSGSFMLPCCRTVVTNVGGSRPALLQGWDQGQCTTHRETQALESHSITLNP